MGSRSSAYASSFSSQTNACLRLPCLSLDQTLLAWSCCCSNKSACMLLHSTRGHPSFFAFAKPFFSLFLFLSLCCRAQRVWRSFLRPQTSSRALLLSLSFFSVCVDK